MKITKAIIPVAGWGTRRLPITKSIEKCMLPIGNRPIVDYTVQDCIKAGITDIYFVVSEQSEQIRDFYRTNIDLNDYLKRNGKAYLIDTIKPPKVRMHYVVQTSYGKYGTSVPVAIATDATGVDESVLVLMGDDFIYNQDESSEVARLIEATPEGSSAILAATVARDEVSRYGVIEINAADEFVRIVEKPTPQEAPSTLINISKYILSPEMLKAIRRHADSEQSGEYLITDPINQVIQAGGTMKVVAARGEYLDGGTVEGWLRANQVVLASP